MSSTNDTNTDYGPNESARKILSEHTWLQGAILGTLAFGMSTVLFFMSFHLLRMRPSKNSKAGNWKKRAGLLIYITIIYILSILYMAGLLQFTQQSFIDDRNYPGGPDTYEEVEFSVPVDMLGNSVMVILTWMCDIINVPFLFSSFVDVAEGPCI